MAFFRLIAVTQVIGWICFALEAFVVVSLLRVRNMGDDAAGRGLGTAYGVSLLPLLLLVGGVLLWGAVAKSLAVSRVGALLAALPFLVMLYLSARGMLADGKRAINTGRIGSFPDRALTTVARAIDAGNEAEVKRLLAAGGLDYAQRDVYGRTLLGHAVFRATSFEGAPNRRVMVRLLLEHGVPFAADAAAVDDYWGREMAVHSGDDYIDLLELALQYGANPNAILPGDDEPLLFAASMTPAKADLLLRFGADVHAIAPGGFQKGWNGLMSAAKRGQWDMARWFLEKGVSPHDTAPDGMTLEHVIADAHAYARRRGFAQYDEAAAFMDEVARREHARREPSVR